MQTRARAGVVIGALAALAPAVGSPVAAHASGVAPAVVAAPTSAHPTWVRSFAPGPGPGPGRGPGRGPAPALAPAEGRPEGWAARTTSVTSAPGAVAAPALATGASRIRVVTTQVVSGQPVITTATVPAAQAVGAVDRAQDAPGAVAVTVDTRVRATAYNDPLRPQQWSLSALGGETFHARVSTAGVTVAVVDTGVDGSHPDLRGVLVPGAQFLEPAAGGTRGTGAVDLDGHGTHVAGIIAAVAHNRLGIAGLAPGTRIMPIRVLDANGEGWSSDIARGIIHAANRGAKVINLSLGGTRDAAVDKAVQYATAKGAVVVAAAGNERAQGNPVTYPAAYANVIGVAATTSARRAAPYSSTGSYVDIAAPGDRIVSTYPRTRAGSGYVRMSGTSMAAPAVSAAVAGLKAARPTLTTSQVQALLSRTAADLGTRGRDNTYGAGLLDPNKALCAVKACPAALTWSGVRSWAPVVGTMATGTVTARTVNGSVLANAPVRTCWAMSHLRGRLQCSDRRTDAAGRVPTNFTVRSTTSVTVRFLGTSAATSSSTTVTYRPRAAR